MTQPRESATFLQTGPVPRHGGFRMEGYWVWCGSAVRGDDGRYHLFASRWPKSVTFHPGWMTSSEVVRAVADTPAGPYQFQEVVLPARGAQFWDGRATHNPFITRCGATYILYYMGSTHPLSDPSLDVPFTLDDPRCLVARANKRVGIAVATSLEGPWTRFDAPILPVRPNTFYSFLTSNPAPCVHDDGSVSLIFKSRQYVGNTHSSMKLGLARAKHFLGPYEVVGDEPILDATHFGEVEDPFVWQTAVGYEMIAKDMNGQLCGERHAAIHARSGDGANWKLCHPAKAYSRTITWDDGSRQVMGQLERPFLLFESGRPAYLLAAAANGPGGFNNATETFSLAIPLKD